MPLAYAPQLSFPGGSLSFFHPLPQSFNLTLIRPPLSKILNIVDPYIIYADLLMTGQGLQLPRVGLVFCPALLTGRVNFSPPVHPLILNILNH